MAPRNTKCKKQGGAATMIFHVFNPQLCAVRSGRVRRHRILRVRKCSCGRVAASVWMAQMINSAWTAAGVLQWGAEGIVHVPFAGGNRLMYMTPAM